VLTDLEVILSNLIKTTDTINQTKEAWLVVIVELK